MSYTQHLKLRLSPGLTSDAVYNLQKIDSLASTFKVDTRAGLRLRSIEDIIIEPHSADIGGDGVGGSLSIGTPDHILESIYFYGSVHFSEGLDNSDIADDAAIEWSKISKEGSSLQDIEDRSHSYLSDIGFNTHEQIDNFIVAVQAYIDNPELTPEDLSVPPGLDGQVLSIQGGGFKWTSVQTDNLSEYSIRVGNAGGEAQSVNTSTEGGILASVGGLNYKDGSIENKHIAGDASIEFSKMEALTPDRVNLTSAEGVVSTSSITGTELGYLAGLEEPITDTFDSIAESISDITDLFGEPNGLATLGSDGKLASSQIPESLVGAVVFQGTWDALVNDPTLESGVGTKGHYYIVNMEGSTDLDGETSWKVGDWAIFSGTAWQKVDNTDAVISVNSKTGIVVLNKTDVGLGNVDNTSDLAKNSAVANLTNKTLVKPIIDDYFDINEEGSPTAPPSGKVRVYAKNDKKLYRQDSTGVEQEIGSGAGGVGVSFFYDDFENGSTANWTGYDNGASAVPVDGTGGTASALTVEASSSSPLRGGFSLSVSKTDVNAQGQGVAASFAIPSGYQQGAKRALEFLWDGTDANYAAGDMRVYIYDVTNATLITPEVSPQLPAAKTPIQLSWDASSSASYRLIFHVATTNASAYSVKIDDVTVGPGEVIPMPASHGAITFTPVYTAQNTNPTIGSGATNSGWYSRNSDGTATIHYEFSAANAGTAGDGYYIISLPPGLSISDNLGIGNSGSGSRGALGIFAANLGTGSQIKGQVHRQSATEFQVKLNDGTFWRHENSQNFSAANLRFSMHLSGVPIAEWADSPSYVASAKQAVVSAKFQNKNQTGIAPNNSVVRIEYDATLHNVGGGTLNSNAYYTVPQTGYYRVNATINFNLTNILSDAYFLRLVRGTDFSGTILANGPIVRVSDPAVRTGLSLDTVVLLNQGDNIILGVFGYGNNSSNTLSTLNADKFGFFEINRLTDEYGRPVVGFGYATPDSSGLVSTGTQTFAGNKSFTDAIDVGSSIIYGGRLISNGTSVNQTLANNATHVVVAAPPIVTSWIVEAFASNSTATEYSIAFVRVNNAGVIHVTQLSNSGLTLTASGSDVIVTNTSGGSRSIRASALRLY